VINQGSQEIPSYRKANWKTKKKMARANFGIGTNSNIIHNYDDYYGDYGGSRKITVSPEGQFVQFVRI
jgi:hypothetical protein